MTKAIESGDLSPELMKQAYAKRGEALRQKGDLEAALNDLDAAITIDPQYDWAYWKRGIAHREKMDFDKAIADLDRAVEINAKPGHAFISRGGNLQIDGRDRQGDIRLSLGH